MNSQQKFLLLILVVVTMSVWASGSVKDQIRAVLAIEADADYGEYLADECQTCHISGTAAGERDPNIPVIHGQPPEETIQALLEYRNETRDNQTMRSIAGALSDDEIAALSKWFSEQP